MIASHSTLLMVRAFLSLFVGILAKDVDTGIAFFFTWNALVLASQFILARVVSVL